MNKTEASSWFFNAHVSFSSVIEKGILDTLSKMGVEEIDTNGKFNPELHQAIDTENSEEHESGDIIKVASKGFTYKGKVIRYSQVIVKK